MSEVMARTASDEAVMAAPDPGVEVLLKVEDVRARFEKG